LGLDPDKVRVAGRHPLPLPFSRVLGFAGGDHVEGTGPTKAQLGQGADEVGPAVAYDRERGEVPVSRGRCCGVVAEDALDLTHFGDAARLPAWFLDHGESSRTK